VVERVLELALDRAVSLAPHELLSPERPKMLLDRARSDPVTAASEPAQNTFPSTAASCSSRFSSATSESRRAAMIPCTVSGSASPTVPPSASIRANCSA
jgi:hypothetical protein